MRASMVGGEPGWRRSHRRAARSAAAIESVSRYELTRDADAIPSARDA